MRDSFDREIREALHREPIPVPEEVNAATQRLLEALPDPPPRAARPLLPRLAALAACLALMTLGIALHVGVLQLIAVLLFILFFAFGMVYPNLSGRFLK